MWIASAQDAQKAAGAILDAERNPRPPIFMGSDAMHCAIFCWARHLGDHANSNANDLSHSLVVPRGICVGLVGRKSAEEVVTPRVQHTGAKPATRIAGRERWEWRPTILARSAFVPSHISCTNASDPNGVPKIFTPRGLHTSGPSSSHSGWADAFSVPHPCFARMQMDPCPGYVST